MSMYYGNMTQISMFYAEDGILYDLPGENYNVNVIGKKDGTFEVQIFWFEDGSIGDFQDIDGSHTSLAAAMLHGKRYVQAVLCGAEKLYKTSHFVDMDDDDWHEYLKKLPKYKEYTSVAHD